MNIEDEEKIKEEVDEKLIQACYDLARNGIDLENLFKSIDPLLKVLKEVVDLTLKNYKFLKEKVEQNA